MTSSVIKSRQSHKNFGPSERTSQGTKNIITLKVSPCTILSKPLSKIFPYFSRINYYEIVIFCTYQVLMTVPCHENFRKGKYWNIFDK